MAIEVPIYYNDDREKDKFGGLYKDYQNREPVDPYEEYNKEPVDTYEFDVQGDQYEVDVPKGGTIEEAWDKLQKTINYQAPEPAPVETAQDGEYQFKTEETSGLRDVADVGTSALSGTFKAAGGLVGIGNYIPLVDQISEPLSAWLIETGGDIDQALLSDRQLEMKQILSDKIVGAVEELGPDASVGDYFDYVVDTGGAVADFIKDNPGQIFNLIAESAPQVVAGGVFAKGAKVLGASTKVAVPAGETVQMIGMSGAETSMSQEGNDQSYLENKVDLYKNIPTNVLSGVGTYFTGGLQRKLGLDVDTAILNKLEGKSLLESTTKGFGKKTLAAGIEAGEEMFQEPLQQIGQNWAQDKNLMEGVGGSAVIGGITGFSQSAGLSSTGAVYNKAKELLGKNDTSADAVSKIAEVVQEKVIEDASFEADIRRAINPREKDYDIYKLAAQYELTPTDLINNPIIKQVRKEFEEAKTAAEFEAENEKVTQDLKTQRATHAKTFVSQKNFEKLGKQDEDAVNTANALDPNTELGKQFQEWQMENDDFIYEDNEAEVVSRFLKEIRPDMDGAARREMHLNALDEHAAWKASGQNADPEYIADLVARRKAAIEQRDVTTLNAVETEAAENLMPGEWTNAKLQALKPPAKTTKETETQTAEEISVKPETTETVVEQPKAKPVPIKKQAENLVSSLFGEDWRNDQEVMDAVGTNVDTNTGWTSDVKRGTLPKAIREINKILAARGRESEAIMNNEQVPWYAERAKGFNEARRQAEEAAAAEAETKAQQEEQAAVEADPLQAENDLVTSLIDNKDFSLKTKDVMALSKENRKRYKDAAKAAKKKPAPVKKKVAKKKVAKKKATPKKQVAKVEPKDVAPQQVAATTLTDYLNEGATGRNRLTASQQKVADVLQKASLSNDLGNLITPRGTFNYTEIAKRAGLKNRSAAQQAFIQLRKKIEKKAGNKTLKEFFAQSNRNQGEEVDETMQQLEGTVDTSTGVSDADANLLDVDSGMTKRKSPNDSQVDVGALNKEDKAAVDKAAEEKGRKEQEQKVAEQRAKSKEFLETNIYSNADVLNQLRTFWNMGRPQGAMDFDSLPDIHKEAFVMVVATMGNAIQNGTLEGAINLNDGNIEASEEVVNFIKEEVADTLRMLANDQKEEKLQQRIDDENKGTNTAQITSGTQEDESAALSQGAEESGQAEGQTKGKLNKENQKLIEQANNYAQEKLGENWFVDDKTLRDLLSNDDFKGFQDRVDALVAKGVKYSLSEEDKPKNAATRQTIRELFDNLVGKDAADELFDSGRVTIFKSAAEASAILGQEIPAAAKGFVTDDKRIFFVTDNIRAGNEMGIFMHEVGVHVGISEILKDEGVEEIYDQIISWALTSDGKESQVAGRAIAYVSKAIENKQIDEEFVQEEVVAYFVEEMVNSGVEPSADTKEGKLLKRIWDAFQNALRNFLGKTDVEVTGRDIVDMAYGAAWKALSKDVKTHANGAEKPSFRREPILYSLNQDKNKKEVDGIIENLKKTNPGLAAKIIQTQGVAKRGVNELKFVHQLIEEYAEVMPSLVRLDQEFGAKRMTANEIKFAAEDILQRAEGLSAKQQEIVSELIAASTLEQKWAYDPRDSHPEVFDKKFGANEEIEIDPVLQAAFDALSENEQQIIKDIFAHGEQMLQRKQEIAKKLAGKDSNKFFTAAGLRGPYAPLKRFGDWVTVLKSDELVAAEKAVQETNNQQNRDKLEKLKRDSKHYVVSMFDSQAEANEFLFENQDNYSQESEVSMKEQFLGLAQGSPVYQVLQQVLGEIKADDILGHSQDLSPSEKKIVEDVQSLIAELYIRSLDDTNARTTQLKRQNRAGFEKDMFKAFRSNSIADAGLISTMEHGERVHQLMSQARKEASNNRAELMPVWNLLQFHYHRVLAEHRQFFPMFTALQNKVASVNTLWMLTSSLGYHVQNATQPAVVTIPRLAGDFGGQDKAWKALGKGYKVAAKIVGLPKLQSFNPAMFFKPRVTIDFDKLTGENAKYKELLETLQLKELLDVGLEQDLYEADTKNSGFKYIDKANNLLNKVSHAAYQYARMVEMYNRVSAAVAAYDLAEADPDFITTKNITKARKSMRSKNPVGITPMTSMDYAISVVQDTQGNFSEADAPAIIKRANMLSKFTMQYQKYRFLMAWAYTNAAKTWINSSGVYSKQEKQAAGRTFMYMNAYAAAAGGIIGTPFLGILFWAGGELGDLLDEDEEDWPTDLKSYLNENLEDGLTKDLLTKGVGGMVGLDGNAKLSQENIFKMSPYSDFGRTAGERKEWIVDMLLGPTSQWIDKAGRFEKHMQNGDPFKAAESVAPNGIKFPMESYRLKTEGYTNGNGDVLVENTKFSNSGLIANALTLPASEIKDLKYKRQRQYEIIEWFKERNSEIKTSYNNAWKSHKKAAGKDKAKYVKKMNEAKQEFFKLQEAKTRASKLFGASTEFRRRPITDLTRYPLQRYKTSVKEKRRLSDERPLILK